MRVLVTGASGFIGRHFISQVSDRYELFAGVRDPSKSESGGRSYVLRVDLSHPLDMKALPPSMDAIVHLAQANATFPEGANELLAVNTNSTQQLLDYARRVEVHRFILISTGDVYGRRFGLCKEGDPVAAASYYALTKQAAEMLAQAYADYLQVCILRLFHPYGPKQTHRLIPNLGERIKQRDAIRLHSDGRPRFTPTYIDDVVMAIERAINSSYSGIVNVAGDRIVGIRELAEEIGSVLEKGPIFQATNEEASDWMGDNALMKEVFGAWPMTNLSDGLRRTFKGEEERRCQANA
jgi:UDP-glucose 4-epimerase